MKKSRDLQQAFEKLKTEIVEFENEKISEGMDRIEVEGVIRQVNRLQDKLEKYRNIVSRNYKY
jgi:hypothetical protein